MDGILFSVEGGPGPQIGRVGAHLPRDQSRSAKADITILNNMHFFPNGVDGTKCVNLTTMSDGGKPSARTDGVGTAEFYIANGTKITLANAHFMRNAPTNIWATQPIKDKIIPDLTPTVNAMVDVHDGGCIPFDAGYCSIRVWPMKSPYASDDTPRHPAAAQAIFATGILPGHIIGEFGNVVGGGQIASHYA